MVRKELDMTKVQLNLDLTDEFDDELSDSNEVSVRCGVLCSFGE